MSARKYMVGGTVVYADKHGPYRFERAGVQVPCVCDERYGLICAYHERDHRRGNYVLAV